MTQEELEQIQIDTAISALSGEPSINQRLTNLETKQTMLLSALNDLHETMNEIACEIRRIKHDI